MKRPYSDIITLAETVGGDNPKLQNRVLIVELGKILKDMEARLDAIEKETGPKPIEKGNEGRSQSAR